MCNLEAKLRTTEVLLATGCMRLFVALLLLPLTAFGDDFATEFESRYIKPVTDEVPGAALVVVVGGEVKLNKTYGVLDADSSEPVTDQSLFRIASISKTFASAAASLLVRDTEVTWQTPLSRELSDLRFKSREYGERINLWHIMSQTSGLMPHAYTNLIEERMSYDRIVDRLHKVDFVCEPGRCYGYQNVVFSLVGDVVEAQTKVGYAEFVNKELFQPLGMERASFGHASYVDDEDRARPHVWTGKRWRSIRSRAHYYKVPPAAGVNASISDMSKWLQAQLGQHPRVLSQPMLDEMQRGVIRTSRHQAHYPYRKELGNVFYGLGWRVFDYGGETGFVHHGGYVRGMTSTMVFHRESQTGIVFLTNSEPRGINQLVLDFAALHEQANVSRDGSLAAR